MLHETAFSAQGKITCLQKQSCLNFCVWWLCDLFIRVNVAACRVTIVGWWTVFLGFCKEQKMKYFKKFQEESVAMSVQGVIIERLGLGW